MRILLFPQLFFLFILLPSDCLAQSLSGVYTIGGINPDFPGLQAAMDTAAVRGVSGNVEFVLRPGTYSGLYNFYDVPGTGPNSKLIVRSENNDSASVNITGQTNANQTVMMRLYDLRYLEFHHLGFSLQNSPNNSFAIGINRGKYIGFYHCSIKGYPSSSARPDFLISGAPDTGYVVKSCYFALSTGGLFVSNSAFGFRNALIENCVFEGMGSESIYVNGGAFTQIKNNIISAGGGSTAKGILMSGTSRFEISGNRIYLLFGTLNSTVVQLISSSGWPTQKSRIFNNVFFLNSSTSFVAYNFRSSSSYNIEIAHNTFYMNGGSSAHVFYMQGTFVQNQELDIHNNIFYRHDTIFSNHLFRIPNLISMLPWARSDHNVFYSNAPVFNAQYNTFSDHQNLGVDSHSVYTQPQFLADSLLKFQNPLIENIGTPLPWVVSDIEGNTRHPLHPDPGAYETLSAPIANLGPDTLACESYTLHANAGGAAVLWSDNSQADSLMVSQTGWYALTLSNAAGSSTDSVYVVIQNADSVFLSCSSLQVCAGTSVSIFLNSSNPGSFFWNDTLSHALSRLVVVNSDTLFSGIWVAQNGCLSRAEIALEVFPAYSVNLTLPDSIWCSNAGTYLLSGGIPAGGIFSGNGVTGNLLDPSSFSGSWAVVSYVYTDTNACSYADSDSIFIDLCSSFRDFENDLNTISTTQLLQLISSTPSLYIMGFYNMSGQSVKNGGSFNETFAELPPGIYALILKHQGRTVKLKIPKHQ